MTYRKINHAFIMAAGRGTRLMPLTKKIPKGLVKFKQTSLIARGIKRLKKYINFVHISVGYKGPILAKHLIEEKVSSIINTDKKGQPLCMLIPTKPIKGLAGDFIFKKKNIVKKLSRTQKSDIYCTGIQILNPKKINDKVKPTDDFNILWKKLIKIRQLYVSDVMPKKWYTVDNLDNLKKLKKIFK